MYPHERSLVKQYADAPFALIGVNSDDDREQLKKVLVEEQITWRSFWNGGSTQGGIAGAWNVRSWPTIYVIDAKGVIRYKNVRDKALDAALATLIEEASGKSGPPH